MKCRSECAIPRTTSASQLTCYAMCPRKYYFQYCTDTEREFVSTNLVLGSAVHSAIGWFFEEKLAGRTPTIEGAEEIFGIDVLASTTDVNVRWKDSTPKSLDADGRRFVRAYLTRFGDLDVARVEEPFEVRLEDAETETILGRPIKGYFDLVLRDESVIEIKTSARGWSEFDLVRHLQLGTYSYARGQRPDRTSRVLAHVIIKLKKEPRIEEYPIERVAADNRWWLQAAGAIERAIEAGIFPPSPGPLCHECEYQRGCANWTEAPVSVTAPHRLPVIHEREHCLAL